MDAGEILDESKSSHKLIKGYLFWVETFVKEQQRTTLFWCVTNAVLD